MIDPKLLVARVVDGIVKITLLGFICTAALGAILGFFSFFG